MSPDTSSDQHAESVRRLWRWIVRLFRYERLDVDYEDYRQWSA